MKIKPSADKYLIVVIGPTAVGKTDLRIQLTQRIRTEIILTDSRKLYQGVGMGTAQPTKEQLSWVKRHSIDYVLVEKISSLVKCIL